jgi:hypothetical protein
VTRIEKLTIKDALECIKAIEFSRVDKVAMDYCIFLSTSMWAGYIDDVLACVWGLMPPTLLSQQAYLWLYTTDVIKGHEFILVRHSQLVMEDMLKQYPSIVGHAVVNNHKAIRWLRWLGAEFGPQQGNGLPFRITAHG